MSAEKLRQAILAIADQAQAAELATEIANSVIGQLNERCLLAQTNLLTQILIGRCILEIAHDWLHDIAPAIDMREYVATPEDCKAAVRSFLDQLPEGMTGTSYIDPVLVDENKRRQN